MLTDGITDQFGKDNLVKFGKKRLFSTLKKNSSFNLSIQKIKIENEINEWLIGAEQIDDITMLAIKI